MYYTNMLFPSDSRFGCRAANSRCGRVRSLVCLRVTYDAGGGRGGLSDIGLAPGALYCVKTPATVGVCRPGYTFTGWNTSPDGSGVTYLPCATVPLSTSLMLYAQWTR